MAKRQTGGQYTERDVREAARAFTGWSVDREDLSYRFRPASGWRAKCDVHHHLCQLYSTVARNWWGVSAEAVTRGRFEPVKLLRI